MLDYQGTTKRVFLLYFRSSSTMKLKSKSSFLLTTNPLISGRFLRARVTGARLAKETDSPLRNDIALMMICDHIARKAMIFTSLSRLTNFMTRNNDPGAKIPDH
jgi:hypothetical protein